MSTATLERPPLQQKPKRPAAGLKVYHPDFGEIEVPRGIDTLDDFRNWIHSGKLPEKLAVQFFDGIVRLDVSMEELDSHNFVKSALTSCLFPLMKREKLGFYTSDGMMLTNEIAQFGTRPDAMIILNDTFKSGRILRKASKKRGAKATELAGTPDIVIEIISPSSVSKDHNKYMHLYHLAGIPEYWLIDALGDKPVFDIYRQSRKRYSPTVKDGDWVRSHVLAREFRLAQSISDLEMLDYELVTR